MYFSKSRYPLFRATTNFYGNSVTCSPDPLSEDSINDSARWCLHKIKISRPRQLHLHLSSPIPTVSRTQGSSLGLEYCLRGYLRLVTCEKEYANLDVPMDISAPGTDELSDTIHPHCTQRWPLVRTRRSACRISIHSLYSLST